MTRHILGSAIIEVFITEEDGVSKLVYSGDLGSRNRPILRDPKIIKKADYVIMESTYGNRIHERNSDSIEKLVDIVLKTIRRGGNVIIPSFAVGRTQELIYQFSRFYKEHSEYKGTARCNGLHGQPQPTSAPGVPEKRAGL